ncbi:MAG: hypothetical protein QGD94_08495, partial [Planctomycetia bacterium]|nr:hypothetical protein [Planctomycetia bacterium]
MKRVGRWLRAAAFVCLALSAAQAGAETWRQEKTDEFTRGTWQGIIVRTPGGVQLDIEPAEAAEVFDAPETYVMGV